MARGADDTKRLMGSGYGCYVENGTGAGDVICMPSHPPTPPPVPTPTPTPTPTPPTPNCSHVMVKQHSMVCDSGLRPADTDTMTACSRTICDLMGTWDMARGADPNKRFMGLGYGCIIENGSGTGSIICMSNNTTPVPTPTQPPPAPTPPPSVPCSSLSIIKQSSSCNLGWTPADTETMVTCSTTICGLMDNWDMARGADGGKRLMGSGYGCYVENGTGVGNVICMPSHLISK